jgi:hypothetical protein
MLRTVVAALALAGCCGAAEVVPAAPSPPRAPDFDYGAACLAAEARLIDLACKRADGSSWATTPAGSPFGKECRAAWADGRDWHPECLAAIADCGQIEPAYRGDLCPAR